MKKNIILRRYGQTKKGQSGAIFELNTIRSLFIELFTSVATLVGIRGPDATDLLKEDK